MYRGYHGVEIGETIDESGSLGEALLEGVAEIVSGVGGDDENGGSDLGEEDGEYGATGGFADAALAADEHPLQALLFQNVLDCSFQ